MTEVGWWEEIINESLLKLPKKGVGKGQRLFVGVLKVSPHLLPPQNFNCTRLQVLTLKKAFLCEATLGELIPFKFDMARQIHVRKLYKFKIQNY